MMDFEEIKRRLKNGATVQILADLNGVTYKTMYNRLAYYERRDGVKYMNKSHLKPERTKKEKKPAIITDPVEAVLDPKTRPAESKKCASCISCNNHFCEEFNTQITENMAETCQCFYKKAETYKEREKKEAAEIYTADLRDSLPADVYTKTGNIPEDISKSAVIDVLTITKQKHADAIKALHEAESILENARNNEMQLRTMLVAMQRLAEAVKV